MAKKATKPNEVEGWNEDDEATVSVETATPEAEPALGEVNLRLPVATPPEGHATRHVEVQLSHEQALALKRLRFGLDRSSARLKNGRPIVTAADVFRWICEQVGAA